MSAPFLTKYPGAVPSSNSNGNSGLDIICYKKELSVMALNKNLDKIIIDSLSKTLRVNCPLVTQSSIVKVAFCRELTYV